MFFKSQLSYDIINDMEKNIKLITTDSYFNLFPVLNECLKSDDCKRKQNYIFCEDKISLFVERSIAREFGGTFNTQVFSFGSYLKSKKTFDKTLSKEGSAMVIRKLLLSLPLKCFVGNKNLLAPSIFDLLILLKSAKVGVNDVKNALSGTNGILKNKLSDVYLIYSAYENYLKENGLEDQSSVLSYLPSVINEDDELAGVNVFLLGFTAFTSQTRDIIESLFKKAVSVTAILTSGENPFLFVNETAGMFESLVRKNNLALEKERVLSPYEKESKVILNNLFGAVMVKEKIKTDKILVTPSLTMREEIERVAVQIRSDVIKGARYKDFTLCLPSADDYKDVVREVFYEFNIPYFLDEKKNALNHPLVKLIVSYIEAFRFNKEREKVLDFAFNPLVCEDKKFLDEFANYLYKHNVNYGRLNASFDGDEEGKKFEDFRKRLCSLLDKFDVEGLLQGLNVKEKLEEFSLWLSKENRVENAVNEQVYDYIDGILNEIDILLKGVNLSLVDYKNVFLSGVSALELSIIPQYNDAVFVGEYKECALAKSNNLFLVGLSGDVPTCKNDVSLLTDSDINKLSEIKVLVEPKIQIVNAREREQFGLGLTAFKEKLYLSYVKNEKKGKSIALSNVEDLFDTQTLEKKEEFLTYSQGLKSFAKICRKIASGEESVNVDDAGAFFALSTENADRILKNVNSEMKVKLDLNEKISVPSSISPTRLEKFYSCPFMAFCENTLSLKEREEGKVDGKNLGSFIHDVLELFVKKVYLEKSYEVKDFDSCDILCSLCASEVQGREEYSFLSEGSENVYNYSELLRETKKYCRRIYERTDKSLFKPYKTEARIGTGGDFAPISILDGKIKIVGIIDRIDTYKDYFRIIDYKTGSSRNETKDLFVGSKLQLYLYSMAVKDKKLAGAHYMKLSDEYVSQGAKVEDMLGNTLNAKELENAFLLAEGKNKLTEEELNAFVEYATFMSEQAGRQIQDGVIVASPLTDKACQYCQYKGICAYTGGCREMPSIKKEAIVEATKKMREERQSLSDTKYTKG